METIKKDTVSIITIVLNGEKYIEETIISVLNQENVKIEYIVIDGGSKDNTLQKIKKYENKIDILISEQDHGIYDAINKGINLASGSLIGLIHCGDFYAKNAVSLAYNEYIKTNAEIIYGDITTIEVVANYTTNFTKSANHFNLRKEFSIFHPATFVSNNCYKTRGVYDSSYKIAADYDLFLKYFIEGISFSHIPIPLAFFRLGGLSGKNFSILVKENIRIKVKFIGYKEAIRFAITSTFIQMILSLRNIFIISIIGNNNFSKLKLHYHRKFLRQK